MSTLVLLKIYLYSTMVSRSSDIQINIKFDMQVVTYVNMF
jgi:hypothetical protein